MKTKHLRLMQRVYIILFFCFMYLPIAYMIVFSFNQSKGYSLFTGFTFKWYRSLFTNASILHALWVSVEAVSYTHLDVYKRQYLSRAEPRLLYHQPRRADPDLSLIHI